MTNLRNELAPICGNIQTKVDLNEVFTTFEKPLKIIATVHLGSCFKYQPYSWYNDPVNCDGDLEHNWNAILRHLLAHKMGYSIDGDMFTHCEHMVCRAAMLTTNWYRFISGDNQRIRLTVDDARADWRRLITIQELFSLSKFLDTNAQPKSLDLANALGISGLIEKARSNKGNVEAFRRQILSTEINEIDEMFYSVICFAVKNIPITKYDVMSRMNQIQDMRRQHDMDACSTNNNPTNTSNHGKKNK